MTEHSLLSPSGAHRWMRCPGSLLLEKGAPDRSTRYADEGSVAHQIATDCLLSKGKLIPEHYLHRRIKYGENEIVVDHEMVQSVEQFIELVEKYSEYGVGQVLVDKRVDFTDYVAVEATVAINGGPNESGPVEFRKEIVRQTGTADVIIIFPDRIIVIDLKYGRGVKVYAENNEQCRLYALGTLHDYGFLCDPTHIVMVIHQPRLEHLDEDTMSVADLEAWAENEAKPGAEAAISNLEIGTMMLESHGLNISQLSKNVGGPVLPTDVLAKIRLEPGEKQCKFCNAKALCPALSAEMSVTTGNIATAADFADLAQRDDDELELMMLKVPLVETYCKAIRAEIERRLFTGHTSKNFKLVEGRQGNRAWTSEGEAEAAMKAAKLKADDIYVKKIVSPTQAEKNLKKTKPKVWKNLQELITRAPGKPSVALVTDKRPALAASAIAADFASLVSPEDQNEE